jgi:hypothetical protein
LSVYLLDKARLKSLILWANLKEEKNGRQFVRFPKFLRIMAFASVLAMVGAILPVIPALASGTITLTPSTGAPGTLVVISGTFTTPPATTTTDIWFGSTDSGSDAYIVSNGSGGSIVTVP